MFSSVTGPNWPGLDGLRHLVIFGDSYSSVEYNDSQFPPPSLEHPLGIEFPGITYTEDGELPNWVGHLVASRQEGPNPLIVYDYAEGGHTVAGVRMQVTRHFLPKAGRKPDWARWDAKDTLFVTWVGINDCAYLDEHEDDLETLFELEGQLYDAGARNFMFIDVPPIHRSPAIPQSFRADPGVQETYNNWNTNLHLGAEKFHARRDDTTVLMFSAWDMFTRVLNLPRAYGFHPKDVNKAGGRIWMDRLHPTSEMHRLIAHDVEVFLGRYPAGAGGDGDKVLMGSK